MRGSAIHFRLNETRYYTKQSKLIELADDDDCKKSS